MINSKYAAVVTCRHRVPVHGTCSTATKQLKIDAKTKQARYSRKNKTHCRADQRTRGKRVITRNVRHLQK